MEKDLAKSWYENPKKIEEMPGYAKRRLKRWEEWTANQFPAGTKILDVGCGAGREAFALAEMGFSVSGIDISEEAIAKARKQAKENGSAVPFSVYDGRAFPAEDESFGAVIIWAQTFGLLYGDEYKAAILKECARVLAKGGLLSFSGHSHLYEMEHYPQYTDGRKFYPYANTELYWETFTQEELSRFASGAGFDVLFCGEGEVYKPEDGIVLHCLCRK